MTQKIVQTTEHMLSVARATIKQQEEEIRQLKLDVRRLQQETKTKKQPTPLLRDRNSRSSEDNRSQTASDSAPYARPTRASLLRQSTPSTSSGASTPATSVSSSSCSSATTKQAPKTVVIQGTTYTYKNGKLEASGPGYLRSTYASINKFGEHERRREWDYGVCRPPPIDYWCYPRITPLPGSTVWCDEALRPQKSMEILSEEQLKDKLERRQLAIRTRLSDNAWLSERANNVCIDHDETGDILQTAEDLAKWCLYQYLCTHHPRKAPFYFSDLDFGRDGLRDFYWSKAFNYRATTDSTVVQHLECLIQLRNTVHHFHGGSCGLGQVDMHLSTVQELAVLLYDEESAFTARALRDRLRRGAEKVASEIETIELLKALSFDEGCTWRLHHIELFRNVCKAYKPIDEANARKNYSPAVVHGAMEFAEGNPDLIWDQEPKLDASLARVRRLASAGSRSQQKSDSEGRQGRLNNEAIPKRWRTLSTSGPRVLLEKPARTQDKARRGSFSIWEEDKSIERHAWMNSEASVRMGTWKLGLWM
ncbi:hypothetical protein KVR01_006146 [Diaporthe batatas]|uniref:uncharacterized protein n=1 Tax=Diaporthe batatas TaxID=748121 RepID=UPI001D05B914|nr:uncharacterized protein KVR01_006146 [Diaporthe batatas]KAG8164228.1 hypothetical protein KVR01_006146 [Diaporthe batatas]